MGKRIMILLLIIALPGCIAYLFKGADSIKNFYSRQEYKTEFTVEKIKHVEMTPSSGLGIDMRSGGVTMGNINLSNGQYIPVPVPIDYGTPEQFLVYLKHQNEAYTLDSKEVYEKAKGGQKTFQLKLVKVYLGKNLIHVYVSE
ncbi:hypothetical protein ACBQ08_11260 [Aneurinibacillus aneurinilyticus]